MKASLQLKLGQHLTMTPQLQQAIRLLQLSTLELQQEVQQALDANPLLEVEDEFNPPATTAAEQLPNKQSNELNSLNEGLDTNSPNDSYEQGGDLSQSDTIPDQLVVDSNWDDIYQHSPTSHGTSSADDDWQPEHGSSGDSLHDKLLWQLNLTPMSSNDLLIAHSIIDGIDLDGYLRESLDDIMQDLNARLTTEQDSFDIDELEAVLKRIQQFDPPGVAARDLSECLLSQLRPLTLADRQTHQLAMVLVSEHLPALGVKDYANLMRQLGITEQQLSHAIQLIQTLNPRPGEGMGNSQDEYILPDVMVSKDRKTGRWKVELNPEVAPKIRINSNYASLARTAQDGQYLRDHLQEARWLIKSIESRNETLIKVASKIVERQMDFFEQGLEYMKPMVLADIATDIEMHESTISRVTNQKFMHTPRGLFELKYFFSSHVSTTGGGEASSTAIRAMIKKLIAEENPRKPLSDAKLTKLLETKGIVVARRTVAKYRESMNIAPSNERKSLH